MNLRTIITGGPGAGKTTLIEALAQRGFAVSDESGRAVIRAQMSIGGCGVPWRNPQRFAGLMLARDIRAWHRSSGASAPVFYDRGIPDIAGYLTLCGYPIPPRLTEAISRYRYATDVIILPPWRDVYAQDNERKQSWQEAVETWKAMAATYEQHGYRLTTLPPAPPAARAAQAMEIISGR
ncbi:TPA: AAA family ATPase [Pluralibacter gergoviae]